MKFAYPAVFYREEDGRYSVIVPDLEDLATYGDTVADALAMAEEACGLWLYTALKDGYPVPDASTIDTVEKDDDAAFASLVLVDMDEHARKYGDKAVRRTVSLPAWLDFACEQQGINCSKVLQEALIQKVGSRAQ